MLPGVTHLAARTAFCFEAPLKGVEAIRRSKSVFGSLVNWASKSRSYPLVPWPYSLEFINCSMQLPVEESRDDCKTGPQTPSMRCRHPLECKDRPQPQHIDEPRSHLIVVRFPTATPLRRNHLRLTSGGAALLPSSRAGGDSCEASASRLPATSRPSLSCTTTSTRDAPPPHPRLTTTPLHSPFPPGFFTFVAFCAWAYVSL